jgi:hypothetical protein
MLTFFTLKVMPEFHYQVYKIIEFNSLGSHS